VAGAVAGAGTGAVAGADADVDYTTIDAKAINRTSNMWGVGSADEGATGAFSELLIKKRHNIKYAKVARLPALVRQDAITGCKIQEEDTRTRQFSVGRCTHRAVNRAGNLCNAL
jgi:hypothetical protein